MNPFDILNDDVLTIIFNQLDYESLSTSLMRVDHRFARLAFSVQDEVHRRETFHRLLSRMSRQVRKTAYMEGIDTYWEEAQCTGFAQGFEQSAEECFVRGYLRGAALAVYIHGQGKDKQMKRLLDLFPVENGEYTFSLARSQTSAEESDSDADECKEEFEVLYAQLRERTEFANLCEIKWRTRETSL